MDSDSSAMIILKVLYRQRNVFDIKNNMPCDKTLHFNLSISSYFSVNPVISLRITLYNYVLKYVLYSSSDISFKH